MKIKEFGKKVKENAGTIAAVVGVIGLGAVAYAIGNKKTPTCDYLDKPELSEGEFTNLDRLTSGKYEGQVEGRVINVPLGRFNELGDKMLEIDGLDENTEISMLFGTGHFDK